MAYRSIRVLTAASLAFALASCASGTTPGSADDAAPPAVFDAGADAAIATGLPFGEPCTSHAECESEVCYQPSPDEPGYCSEICEDLCPNGYACKTVVISEGVDARVCVPAEDTFCKTCEVNSDCGDTTDLCIDLTAGKFCSIDCSSDPTICPTGFTCVIIQGEGDIVIGEQCKPLNGLCCIDADGDDRGAGDGCRATDCDDDNPAVYDDATEICDGFDNDCIGGVDVDVTDCAPGSCALGMLGYYETPAQSCTDGACAAPSTSLCGLYTCAEGGDLGDACANACDVEDDGKCIPSAHCDASVCYEDLADGEACDEASDCESDHCQNGFCCNAADCCQLPTDCPTYGTIAPVCENPATCQGTRGEAVCTSYQCASTGVEADDSACDGTVESDDCDWYRSVYCSGAVSQTAPACPTSCDSHTDCDPTGHCDLGGTNTCIEDLNNGQACGTDSARCKSGHCQNGFCCSGGDCCQSATNCPASYSTAPVCDSPSTCQGTVDLAQCISSVCSTLNNEPDDSACTGGAPAQECGPYLPIYCNGSINQPSASCPTSCTSDAQCDANAYCTSTNVCAPDQPDGSACNDNAECTSGHCDNGFCCAPGGMCCATDGNCNALDESPQCDSQTTCQGHRIDGVCNPTTYQCATSMVADDSGCAGLISNDCGLYPSVACTTNVNQPADQASRCATTCAGDGDCDVSGHCEAPSCAPDVGPGGFCDEPSDCDAGLTCVDSVCCSSSCTGTCRACDLSGAPGTCTSVPDGTDPDAECSGVGCAGYYWGWTGDTCYRKQDVSTGAASCGGDNACRSTAEECSAQTAQGPAVLTCHANCQTPNGGTCSGTTAGTCSNVNPGNQTCGTGACQRTVAQCAGGTDNACVPGSPTSETCDGIDNDCDGTVDDGLPVDGFESNNVCTSHSYLGNLGEGGSSAYSSMTIYTSGDADWYRQLTHEDDDFCFPGSGEGTYYYTVTMTPPAGKDYDLQVCIDGYGSSDCSYSQCWSSTYGGDATESITLSWGGTCGSEDGRTFYIQVYGWAGANSCVPYSLSTSFVH